ncbi:hypothetical protein KY285_009609 [Solanum tuberosum]|nr:hypothetical protein KY285_009609 [Solanum tuberosum]
MATVNEIRQAQRAVGPATVLAIGMANPLNYFDQSTYPDYYFRVTNSDDKIELKQKFKRMCDRSMIKKRYSYLTEKILKKNPNFCQYKAPSLDARQEIAIVEVPKLGKEAAERAINEWGCSGGATTLRLAKDLAENNKGARVLVVCSELINFLDFHSPSETETEVLVGQALFSDGASAVKMRKTSIEIGLGTTGGGLDWGVLYGFGPGLTIDTVVLRSIPISTL